MLRALFYADMAELADALVSGTSEGSLVQVQVLLSAPSKEDEKDVLTKNPDFIGDFRCLYGHFSRCRIVDVKRHFFLCGEF